MRITQIQTKSLARQLHNEQEEENKLKVDNAKSMPSVIEKAKLCMDKMDEIKLLETRIQGIKKELPSIGYTNSFYSSSSTPMERFLDYYAYKETGVQKRSINQFEDLIQVASIDSTTLDEVKRKTIMLANR